MRHPRHAGPDRTALSLLFALTAASGVMLAVVALALPRAGARAAERALHAYAAYFTGSVLNNADWDIRRALNDRLYVPSRQAAISSADDGLPTAAEWAAAARTADDCRCVPEIAERLQFRLDEATGVLETTGDTAAHPGLSAWLTDTLRALPERYAAAPTFLAGRPLAAAVIFAGDLAPGLGIAVRFARPGPDARRVIYGYAGDVRPWLGVAIQDMLERTPLFPETGRRSNATLVSLALSSASGEMLYDGVALPAAAAGDTMRFMRPEFGGVRAHLAAGPDALRLLRPQRGGGLVIPALAAVLVALLGTSALAARTVRRDANLARARTDFVTSVSHELQTPLAQILMFADMLRLDRLPSSAERKRALDLIVHETERLAHLVANVLYFARADRAGRIGAAPAGTPMQLGPVVEEIVERFLPLADEADVSVELQLEDDVVVAIDRGPVTQILLNLLDNAVKHGRASQVVRVGLAQDGEFAQLSVEDQGPGVEARFRETIWEPFVRLPQPGTARTGMGIGLSVVRDLVLSFGGSVAVEDAPGGGARFVVRLPGGAPEPAGRVP